MASIAIDNDADVHIGKMRKMYAMVGECLNDFLDVLDENAVAGRQCDVKDLYQNLTMDVIATCAFATKINSHRDK